MGINLTRLAYFSQIPEQIIKTEKSNPLLDFFEQTKESVKGKIELDAKKLAQNAFNFEAPLIESPGGVDEGQQITPESILRSKNLSNREEIEKQSMIMNSLNSLIGSAEETQEYGPLIRGPKTQEMIESLPGPAQFIAETIPFVAGGEAVKGASVLAGRLIPRTLKGLVAREVTAGSIGSVMEGSPESAVGIGAASGAISGAFGLASKVINKGGQILANRIEKSQSGEEVLKRIEKILEPEKKDKNFIKKIKEFPTWFQRNFISDRSALRDVERNVLKTVGKETHSVDLARQAELVSGGKGKAQADLLDFTNNVISPIKDNYKVFEQYVTLKRIEDRLLKDPNRKKVADFTVNGVQEGLLVLKKKIGDEAFSNLEITGQAFQAELDKALILQVESGRMSKELYKRIKEDNDFYAPFKVLKFYDETETGFGSGRGLSGVDPLSKKIVGISDENFKLKDPIVVAAELIYRSRILAEKTQVMQKLGDLADLDAEKQFVVKLTDSVNVQKRIGILQVLGNLFKAQKQSLKDLGILERRQKEALTSISDNLSKPINQSIEKLADRIAQTTDEFNTLAQQMEAYSGYPPSLYPDSLVTKVANTEDMLLKMQIDLKQKIDLFDSNILEEGQKRVDLYKDIRKSIVGIYGALDERKSLIRLFKGELKKARNIYLSELDAPKDFKALSYFRNGIVERIAVKKEVADAINGMFNGETMDLLRKVMSGPSTLLRAGATTYNLAFQARNLFFADLPRLAVLSKYGFKNVQDIVNFPVDVAYSFFTSMKGNFGDPNDLYIQWLKSGAANSTIQRTLTPGVFDPTKDIGKGAMKKALALPKKLILDTQAKFANAIEETTKITGLRRALRIEGLDKLRGPEKVRKLQEIAVELRNYAGSPDFPRKGFLSPMTNMVFMFFNANMQGISSDVARLAGKTGKKEAAQAWARISPLAVATISLQSVNNSERYKNDFEQVPQWEKDNYFMIPREKFFKDEFGREIREYWRIPKRGFIKIISNMVESAVDFGSKNDPAAFSNFSNRLFDGFIPINIQGDNLGERLESVASSLNPLLKVPAEYATNRNFFAHKDTVPEMGAIAEAAPEDQYFDSTSAPYVKAGQMTGQSPLKIEQAVRGLTGGAINQFTPGKPLEGRSKGSEFPLLKTFMRSKQAEDKRVDSVEKAIQEQGSQKVKLEREAKKFIDDTKKLTVEQRKEILKTYSKELVEKIADIKNSKRIELYSKLSRLNVENQARAKEIVKLMGNMPDVEERKKFLNELKQNKVLSDTVLDQVIELKAKKK